MSAPRSNRRAFLCGLTAVLPLAAPAFGAPTSAPASAGPPSPALIDDIVTANHILVDQGVLDAFGHVSARHDKNPERFLISRNLAPGLVTAADIMEYDLDGTPVDPRGRASYLERFLHGAIYRARPDVGAVVHSHSPGVIPFSVSSEPLRPLSHMAGFLGDAVPVFEIRDAYGPSTNMLISNPAMGAAVAQVMGGHTVVLLRGHGAVVVGRSVRLAVMHAVYTETNARLQAEAMQLGKVTYLSSDEAAKTAETNDRQVERAWAVWRDKALAFRPPASG